MRSTQLKPAVKMTDKTVRGTCALISHFIINYLRIQTDPPLLYCIQVLQTIILEYKCPINPFQFNK